MVIASSTDFTDSALKDFGVDVIWTSRTKSINNRGDRTFSESPTQTIKVVLHRRKLEFSPDKQGETQNRTGYIMFAPSLTISKDDLITYNGEIWQVSQNVKRGAASTIDVYGYADIFLTNG